MADPSPGLTTEQLQRLISASGWMGLFSVSNHSSMAMGDLDMSFDYQSFFFGMAVFDRVDPVMQGIPNVGAWLGKTQWLGSFTSSSEKRFHDGSPNEKTREIGSLPDGTTSAPDKLIVNSGNGSIFFSSEDVCFPASETIALISAVYGSYELIPDQGAPLPIVGMVLQGAGSLLDGSVKIEWEFFASAAGDEQRYRLLRTALLELEVAFRNFATIALDAASVRSVYVARIRKMSDTVMADVLDGKASHENGAAFANEMRNLIMQEQRQASSALAKAIAAAEKSEGPTMAEMIERKISGLFPGQGFKDLSLEERATLFESIIESAGKSDPAFTKPIGIWKSAGRGLVLASGALAVTRIWMAENRVTATAEESLLLTGGVLGSEAAAALGLLIVPGAPVAITAFVLVGGIAGSLAAQAGWDMVQEDWQATAAWICAQ